MKQTTKFIFDLDGTLYPFAPGKHTTFGASIFYADLRKRIVQFVASELKTDRAETTRILEEVDAEFDGELSIGFERKYGIDRYRYYEATWRCLPDDYVAKDDQLADAMAALQGRCLLLTAAPRSWTNNVLDHLGVAGIFGDHIITGEPDIRKPDIQVFRHAADKLGAHPRHIVSVGDQNHSDVLPAKSLGMVTILIGPEQLDAHYQTKTIHEAINLIKEKLL